MPRAPSSSTQSEGLQTAAHPRAGAVNPRHGRRPPRTAWSSGALANALKVFNADAEERRVSREEGGARRKA